MSSEQKDLPKLKEMKLKVKFTSSKEHFPPKTRMQQGLGEREGLSKKVQIVRIVKCKINLLLGVCGAGPA